MLRKQKKEKLVRQGEKNENKTEGREKKGERREEWKKEGERKLKLDFEWSDKGKKNENKRMRIEVEKVFLRKCKKKCVRRDLHDMQKERQSVVQNVFQAKNHL